MYFIRKILGCVSYWQDLNFSFLQPTLLKQQLYLLFRLMWLRGLYNHAYKIDVVKLKHNPLYNYWICN